MKNKILMISNFFRPHYVGGAEIYAYDLYKELKRKGNEVKVITNVPGANFKDPDVINLNLKVNILYSALMLPDLAVYKAIKKIVADFAPDYIHIHNFHSTLTVSAVYACGDLKPVLTANDYYLVCGTGKMEKQDEGVCHKKNECANCLRGYYLKVLNSLTSDRFFYKIIYALIEFDKFNFFIKFFENFRRVMAKSVYNKIGAVICPSYRIKEGYDAIFGSNRTKHLNYGIDFSKYSIKNKRKKAGVKKFIFGYAGALIEKKGIFIMLDAFAMFLAKKKIRQRVMLYIAGDGADRYRMEKYAETCGIKKYLKFMGKIDINEMSKFYNKIDVILVPSIWPEVMGIVGIEAAYHGVPAIGSNTGGIMEWLKNNKTGLLVKPGSAKDLAYAMLKISMDKNELIKLRTGAKKFIAENFGIQKHVKLLLKIYKENNNWRLKNEKN